ncbi:YciI family protein [Sphingorhabdus sp. Alg239-R122]|uniref:YciI family protein n=1 Tax=Sphingorhabdus sp. Alg239-R122 TaxID=2305989 RepID=UPI0013D9B30A|nr:YciI family protein [Sphingorhabdus sp. Alg239-R122]
MSKFVLVYHGGKTSMSPEEGQQHMVEWMAWMESLGDTVVDRGLAVGKSSTVSSAAVEDNGGSNPISGFTVLEADDLDAAIAMTKKSPHLDIGGTIEIAQAMDMEM